MKNNPILSALGTFYSKLGAGQDSDTAAAEFCKAISGTDNSNSHAEHSPTTYVDPNSASTYVVKPVGDAQHHGE